MKNRPFLYAFLLVFFLPFRQVAAQSMPTVGYGFEYLTLEDGLSQSSITAIVQDSSGFLWLGTQEGLNKYDGRSFRVFKNKTQDVTSISGSFIYALLIDGRQNLWVGTSMGLNKFDFRSETFTRYIHDAKDPWSLPNNAVRDIKEDENGDIWVATDGGLACLKKQYTEQKLFINYKHQKNNGNSLSSDNLTRLMFDGHGNLWVGTADSGINIMDLEAKVFRRLSEARYGKEGRKDLRYISELYKDPKGNAVWVGTSSSIHRVEINYQKGVAKNTARLLMNSDSMLWLKPSLMAIRSGKSVFLTETKVEKIFRNKKGTLWLSTDGDGLLRYSPDEQCFKAVEFSEDDNSAPNNKRIYSITEGRSGEMWFGTYEGGLNKLYQEQKQFKTIRHKPNEANSLSNNVVRSVYQDPEGILWVGTGGGGTDRLDRSTGIFSHITTGLASGRRIPDGDIRAIWNDGAGNLWLGTHNKGVEIFNIASGRNSDLPANQANPFPMQNKIRNIYKDKTGDIWISTFGGGINKLLPDGRYKTYLHKPGDSASLPGNTVSKVMEDSKGDLWVATFGYGLCRYIRETDSFQTYRNIQGDSTSLSHDRVNDIYEQSAERYWLGTYGGGLNLFNPKTGKFRFFTEKDGLPNDVVYGILPNGKYLWMSTNKGISKFDSETFAFVNFDVRDGLQSNEFNSGAFMKNAAGEMFFGGINGLTLFYPDSIRRDTAYPQLAFTGFKVLNRDTLAPQGEGKPALHISCAKEVVLGYEDYFFSIEFAALHFAMPEKNRYKYRLEGFDKNWIHTDSDNRQAVYTNLPFGEYRFALLGSNNDGLWAREPIYLKIIVKPPFWRTDVFYIMLAVLLILAVFSLVKIRENNYKKIQRVLEHKVRLRTTQLDKEKKRLEEAYTEIRQQNEMLAVSENELQDLVATKDKFFSIVAHDMRGPLNSLMGFSSLIINFSDLLSKEEIKSTAVDLDKSLKNMLGFLDNLLSWARSQTGAMAYEPVNINIKELTQKCAALYKGMSDKKGISIVDEIPEGCTAFADLNAIDTVLRNLISNALKFTPAGGSVTLSSAIKENMIEISVRDTGVGIDPESLRKIFRIDSKHSTKGTDNEMGTGLGLALCQEFVAKNKGQMSAESEIGKGTVFAFSIPARA